MEIPIVERRCVEEQDVKKRRKKDERRGRECRGEGEMLVKDHVRRWPKAVFYVKGKVTCCVFSVESLSTYLMAGLS